MSAGYESVVLFAIAVFFGYAFSAVVQYRGEAGILRHVFQVYLALVFGAYFSWFWSEGRRTLPMKTIDLRLVDASGQPLSAARAALRYLLALVFLTGPILLAQWAGLWALALLPVSWIWAAFDRQRCTAYDRMAGTRLVFAPLPRV